MKKSVLILSGIFIIAVLLIWCNNTAIKSAEENISIQQNPQANSTINVIEPTVTVTDNSQKQDQVENVQLVSTNQVKQIILTNENDAHKKQVRINFQTDWKIVECTYSNGYKDYYFQNKLKKEIGTLGKIGRTDDGANEIGFLPNHSSVMEVYTANTILGSGRLYVLDSDYLDENGNRVLTTIDGKKGGTTFKRIYVLVPINDPSSKYKESYLLDIDVPVEETNYNLYKNIAIQALEMKELIKVVSIQDLRVIIESKLDAICNNSNPKIQLSSNPYDSTKDSKDFKDIVNLGDDALRYMLTKFENSKENGLKEYVMAIACSEILKENPETKKWASGREWYNSFIKANRK
ncbi:MAG: hypothetical protein P4L59_11330 [Desulfosporosinus sp.]|nr:hypothetical protein [Desulfosporosinus sp.]